MGKFTDSEKALRRAHRAGTLDERLRQLIEQRRPGWFDGARVMAWFRKADLLEQFFREHGRWPLESSNDPEEKMLGAFCRNARHLQRSGLLKKARFERLDAIPGFEWEPRSWKLDRDEYEHWVRKNGRHPKTRAADPVEARLAQFRFSRRREYSLGKINDDDAKLFSTIPGWAWEDDRTSASLNHFIAWSAEHGRTPTANGDDDEKSAARFRYRARSDYNTGKLSAERLQLFLTAPGLLPDAAYQSAGEHQ